VGRRRETEVGEGLHDEAEEAGGFGVVVVGHGLQRMVMAGSKLSRVRAWWGLRVSGG
jgi:hypothetical protein